MSRYAGAFEDEKVELQELNCRLGQYLSRARQLERDNALLVAEIGRVREAGSRPPESGRTAELRELRAAARQLAFEKNRAEMERDRLRLELRAVQELRREESRVGRAVGGELQGRERELRRAHAANLALEERLVRLESECRALEEAHRADCARLRTAVPVTRTRPGPPAAAEDVEQYALALAESWRDTVEMYRVRMEEMEESVRADQARLEAMEREKVQYAGELSRLRAEMEKQGQIQVHLEDQLVNMQEKFRVDVDTFQMIIEELEHERMVLANTISKKMEDHQDLLQVKMGLGLEVAAYRALLEGEGRHAHLRSDQHSRERIIDIKMPTQPYSPRVPAFSKTELRRPFPSFDFRHKEAISSVRTSQTDSSSASRIVPINVYSSAQQSPAARRDMVAFAKASEERKIAGVKKESEERSVRTKEVSQKPTDRPQSVPPASGALDHKSVRVVSPPMMNLNSQQKNEAVTVERIQTKSKLGEQPEYQSDQRKHQDSSETVEGEPRVITSEKKVLDSVSVEDIIEKVMKPAGLDAKICSSPDSKVTYHIEKTEQEDGSTKTQIILESKVKEDLDISEDFALEELLSKEVKKVSLEDIKGTPTGSMIQNLLNLGLKEGESIQNKSVNVEIIEEPVESLSDEESEDRTKAAFFQPSSMFFQVEELENVHETTNQPQSSDDVMKASVTAAGYVRNGSVQIQESSTHMGTPYYSHDPESQEYFVSTPEDNVSESEELGGFMSYGHYGVLDDLSDERYYQEGAVPMKTSFVSKQDSYADDPDEAYEQDDQSFLRDHFPESIIEEEVCVSPVVQESVLKILKEDTLDPKEQLKEALGHIQSTVSGPLKEELSLFTKGAVADNMSVDIKKVQQASDNGTMTIVAELNVHQTLEDSGLLEQGDNISEEQILSALRSSSSGLHQALVGEAKGGYTMKVLTEEVSMEDMPWTLDSVESGEQRNRRDIIQSEQHITLGPTERSFTLQMDTTSGAVSGEVMNVQQLFDETNSGQLAKGIEEGLGMVPSEKLLHGQLSDPQLKVSHEKRIATVYLDSTKDD
ncbi:synemin [Denticeps clupeoides]|uniref:IF rod domain-containing protein n=1 Tax=Denticeps clupeoides TaxID=299321 RepID=A0AAY4BL66_9TELE|nr:synemin [Denticeps clupeoides]